MSDEQADDPARAASDAIDAWCAANPVPAWQFALPAEASERFGPVPERVEVTYAPATYRVWPYAFHYSKQFGTLYHWYWTCLICWHTTKDLIPTRELAASESEAHVAGHADDDPGMVEESS
jgi:hypothetical protein